MTRVYKLKVPNENMISRIISNDNLAHEIMVIDRTDKEFVNTYMEKLEKPALYILVNRETNKLYVGQTEDSLVRLKNHETKEFWTEAIVFHSKMNTLSTTEVRWLEAKTYEVVSKLGYFDMTENIQKPKYPPLKEDQDIELEPVFEEAKRYICAAGFDIFMKKNDKANPKDIPLPFKDDPTPSKEKSPRYSSQTNLPAYVRYLSNSTMREMLEKAGVRTDITNATDISELNAIRKLIKQQEKEHKPRIHNTYSCAISKYVEFLEHGFTFQDMQHDAMLVDAKKQTEAPKARRKAKPKAPKEKKPRKKPDPPFKFSMIGMKAGDKVIFDSRGFEVTVASDDKIEYQGRSYSLSGFCVAFLPPDLQNSHNAYQGPKYFSYQGKTLKKIRKERETK